MKVHGQQIRAMAARLTHEQVHAVLVGDDEAVPASEPYGGVHDIAMPGSLPRNVLRWAIVSSAVWPKAMAMPFGDRGRIGRFHVAPARIDYNAW